MGQLGESPITPYGEQARILGERMASAEVGSTGSQDRVSDDFGGTTSDRPGGFMGKNTDVAWIQRIDQKFARPENEDSLGFNDPEKGKSRIIDNPAYLRELSLREQEESM